MFGRILLAAFAALLAQPATAAVLLFDFTARVDYENAFKPVGTIITGQFGYDTSITPTGVPWNPSYSEYRGPSIKLVVTTSGLEFSGGDFVSVYESEEEQGLYLLASDGDRIASFSFWDPTFSSMGGQNLPIIFPALLQDPLSLMDDDDAPETMPHSELSFYDATLGVGFDARVLKITPASLSAVPEPGSWALMILGFGIVGAGLRRRRRSGHLAVA